MLTLHDIKKLFRLARGWTSDRDQARAMVEAYLAGLAGMLPVRKPLAKMGRKPRA